MQYAILCFTAEELADTTWTNDEDAQLMRRLNAVAEEFVGQVTYAARLQPTTSAVSVRRGRSDALVMDGPFVESKEHFVGFYVVECESLAIAIAFAQNLSVANPWGSGYEVRPIRSIQP